MSHQELLLEVRDLRKYFPVRKGLLSRTVAQVKAVDGVSFSLKPGECLGLVGESGCGKTTVGRTILKLIEPTSGQVVFAGQDIFTLEARKLRSLRPRMQIIFQDPYSSLNPRMTVMDIIGDAMEVHKIATGETKRRRVRALLEKVGLSPDYVSRYPHEFSGGQRQRIGIARALALNPELIVCDEAVSALDVSIRAQIINLLMDLRSELGLSYLFISHDLSVVRHLADRICVMYLGRLVEEADCASLFERPLHPYTEALLSAVPIPSVSPRRNRTVLPGDVPSPLSPPTGCHFHPRCPHVMPRCKEESPPLVSDSGRRTACFLHSGSTATPPSSRQCPEA